MSGCFLPGYVSQLSQFLETQNFVAVLIGNKITGVKE